MRGTPRADRARDSRTWAPAGLGARGLSECWCAPGDGPSLPVDRRGSRGLDAASDRAAAGSARRGIGGVFVSVPSRRGSMGAQRGYRGRGHPRAGAVRPVPGSLEPDGARRGERTPRARGRRRGGTEGWPGEQSRTGRVGAREARRAHARMRVSQVARRVEGARCCDRWRPRGCCWRRPGASSTCWAEWRRCGSVLDGRSVFLHELPRRMSLPTLGQRQGHGCGIDQIDLAAEPWRDCRWRAAQSTSKVPTGVPARRTWLPRDRGYRTAAARQTVTVRP